MDFDDPRERREWLQRLQGRAGARARRAQMPFTLPPEYTVKLDKDQDGRCAVTGLKFNLDRFPDALVKHPFAPSVDRLSMRRRRQSQKRDVRYTAFCIEHSGQQRMTEADYF